MKHMQRGNISSKLSIEFNKLLKQYGFIDDETNEPKKGARRQQAELSFHSLRAKPCGLQVFHLIYAGSPLDTIAKKWNVSISALVPPPLVRP